MRDDSHLHLLQHTKIMNYCSTALKQIRQKQNVGDNETGIVRNIDGSSSVNRVSDSLVVPQ